ncbi:MAG TPA: TRAP transporter large permease subunit [Methylophilaceae bacterium]|nr:TRAP transporter large permease subunit [Methylophilaceae bacterium]
MTNSSSDTSPKRWIIAETVTAVLFRVFGVVLTLYVLVGILGLVPSSSVEYAGFILGVVITCGMIALRDLIRLRLAGQSGWLFWSRMALAIVGTLMAGVAGAYIMLNADQLEVTAPFFSSQQMLVGIVFMVGILILTLIHWGAVLTTMIAAGILYFFFGDHIHNILFTHPHYEPAFVMNYIGLGTTQGFFWFVPLASNDIYFLVIYAGVLLGLGMLRVLVEVGKAGGRHVAGGAALPAVVGSGIVAAVMGQAVSNVMMVGRLTIPMMKKYGYSPAMAGAIESCASSSGQIMPPVLGLAAFLIASFLNIAYIHVALASVIPALLYLSGITIAILVYAKRHQLPKLTESVDTRMIVRLLPTFLVSFIVVVVLLLRYYSPSIAGLAGVITAVIMSIFQGRFRPTREEFFLSFEESLGLVAMLSLLLVAIGPLGQSMLTTNLSGRLGTVMLEILPNNLLAYLAGTMVVALILGMGLPTPVAYLIAALALVPFLQQLGLPALEAHFFVFYFAVFSTLTPPVNVAVMASTKISGATIVSTSVNAIKLACTTFIIPYAFVYDTELMAFPHVTWRVIPPIVEVLLIQWTASLAAYGYFRRNLSLMERTCFTVITLLGFAAVIHYRNPGDLYLYHILFLLGLVAMVAKVSLGSRAAKLTG